MMMYQMMFYPIGLVPDVSIFSLPGTGRGKFAPGILALTLYDLAAVIMVLITLAGIARLLNPRTRERESDDDCETDCYSQQDGEDEECEEHDSEEDEP